MRLLCAALLALPLAGCLAPAQAPALPVPGVAAPPLPAGSEGLPATITLECPPLPVRSEAREGPDLVVRVQGCLAASEPMLLGGLPGDIKVDLTVPQGTRSLLVLVHLHGRDAMTATLEDPWGDKVAQRAEGSAGADSVARFEAPEPKAGAWTAEADLEGLAVARAWSVTGVLRGG
jgi:hypothetical protein